VSWPRAALVTGAGGGLGLALAARLVAQGAAVFGLVRRRESAEALLAATDGGARVILGDVTDPSVEGAVAEALDRYVEELDLLVNNAGATASGRTLPGLDPAEVLRLVDLHCNGALRCTRAALPALRRAARPVVINVSSRLASLARVSAGEFDGLRVSYAMRISKAALNMATTCLARELAADRIAVHCVHPGRILTRMASADADTTPDGAAASFLRFLESLPPGVTGGYWDTGGRRLPW
jgi:NAD(P)-dependent dehydrogenase (short-subunit alcohol dehydrogenase family)